MTNTFSYFIFWKNGKSVFLPSLNFKYNLLERKIVILANLIKQKGFCSVALQKTRMYDIVVDINKDYFGDLHGGQRFLNSCIHAHQL